MITDFIDDGNDYPAVGISFGLTSIYELLKERNLFNEKSQTDIYIIPINTEIESLNLANEIRTLGYNVEIEMNKRKIKKSMDYANKEKIEFVIVLGETEVNEGFFYIKNMFNGKEEKVNFFDIKELNKILLY